MTLHKLKISKRALELLMCSQTRLQRTARDRPFLFVITGVRYNLLSNSFFIVNVIKYFSFKIAGGWRYTVILPMRCYNTNYHCYLNFNLKNPWTISYYPQQLEVQSLDISIEVILIYIIWNEVVKILRYSKLHIFSKEVM